ncbi:tRNA delta(2)-isopentenylpyrophosphate transferase [Petrotoga sp. 9PW.55.5.1]|uniref:tRNA (adenosine(37)-N6)-dimethylallyltransferase MiaA n=1 Tax=Petrotoga sp. 9PW.55.5.1 TaxID=1308979 RepID=UPI000DC60099|nr:tRNA (adenosine(37)-N6)-dimethylallyltransferase MiaA [Petrotoga sp. 9PW.55.5.1]RAO98889.1 tRNA delta(2)-isopentenylpyrophosphate transferase [Petrotoga sp. 9PW.55.5.1]
MNKVLIIAGPTAVGKTEISIELAQKINGEIICMDSRQIYKQLNIGTARPSEEEEISVPHHLFGVIDIQDHFTAFDYKFLAERKISEVLSRNRIPILVGGTGLYIDALKKGFLNVKSDYGLRTYLRKLETNNPGILRKILVNLDPERALKIHPNDIKRIIRALEIFIITGNKMGDVIKVNQENKKTYDYIIFIIDRNREELHQRINSRVEKMLEIGLIDETKEILNFGYSPNLNALNTIGYKEVIQYLHRQIDYESMVHKIKVNTRNYARRQIIYFRKIKDKKWINISETDYENLYNIIRNRFL